MDDVAHGVAACDGLRDTFEDGVFVGVVAALGTEFTGGSGGFAERLTDFILSHSEGDFFLGDEFLDQDLAVVDLFEIGVEVRVGVDDIRGFQPTGDVPMAGTAADAVGSVTESDERNEGARGHGAEGALEVGVVVDRGFGRDLNDDRFWEEAFDRDGAGFIRKFGH